MVTREGKSKNSFSKTFSDVPRRPRQRQRKEEGKRCIEYSPLSFIPFVGKIVYDERRGSKNGGENEGKAATIPYST
jgi:hypothetical protein